MDILLVATNTIFNRIVRMETNSPWGHSNVVIDNIVYDYDVLKNNKYLLSNITLDKSISRATLFSLNLTDGEKEAEELYKKLFNMGSYDTMVLSSLKNKLYNGRDLNNIQSSTNLYTCSNLIAKVINDNTKHPNSLLDILEDVHWSQVVPNDYSNLEFKEELIGDLVYNKK